MNKNLREMAKTDTIAEFTYNDTEYRIIKYSWEGFDKHCWELQRDNWTVIWQAEPDTQPCESLGIILNLLGIDPNTTKEETEELVA